MNPIAPTEIVSHGEAVVRSFGETMAQIRLDDFGVGYFIATHDSNSYRLFVGIRDCSHKIEYPPTQLRVEPHECLSHRKTIWGGNKFEQMSG